MIAEIPTEHVFFLLIYHMFLCSDSSISGHQIAIMEMAQQIEDRIAVIRGAPVVEPSNSFVWLNGPHWILLSIHLTLFQVNFVPSFFITNPHIMFFLA